MRFSEGLGRQVISTKDARAIGTVRRFVVDAPAGRVVAIQLQGPDGADLIDWQHVSNFGTDAVMVRGAELLRPASSPWEERYVRGEFDLRGNLVLTDDGEQIGRLTDVEFDESDGRLRALVLGEGERQVDRLIAVGPYAVIVPA